MQLRTCHESMRPHEYFNTPSVGREQESQKPAQHFYDKVGSSVSMRIPQQVSLYVCSVRSHVKIGSFHLRLRVLVSSSRGHRD